MARMSGLQKMSFAELAALRAEVERTMVDKQGAERTALRAKMADIAKQHGLSLDEVLGKSRKGRGSIAPKCRDPRTPGPVGAACHFGWWPQPRETRPGRTTS
jgi:hypothetical protein